MTKKHTIKRILLVTILIYLILVFLPKTHNVTDDNVLRASKNNDRPLLIAHGGGNHEFPDNTLEAFYNAFYVDPNVMLETDVSLTKDGVVLLSHDTTLDRKTTMINAPIIEVNYSDLITNEIDFGYHNDVSPNSNGFNVSGILKPYRNFSGEAVTPLDVNYPEGVTPRHSTKFLATTLEELIMAFPNSLINVEIKQTGETGLKALEHVIELLDALDEDYNTYGRIVLATFHKEIFDQMTAYKTDSHEMLMIAPERDGVIKFYALHVLGLSFFYRDKVHVLQLPTSQYGLSLSTKGIVRTANRHNIAIHYWTIDDEDEMRRLILLGADGIMTNRPTLLKNVIDDIYG